MKKHSFLSDKAFTKFLTAKLTLLTIAILTAAIQVSAQTSDTNAPQITDFSFASSVIDTTAQAQNLVVNLSATDDNSGVSSIVVRFRSASGNQFVNAFINGQQRVSGDAGNGTYSGTAVFPQYSKAGEWSVLEIEIRDEANNYKTLGTAEIAALGFANTLQVVSGNEDLTAPEVIDLRFDKTSVDTTSESQIVTYTIRVTDAFSGVRAISLDFSEPTTDYLIPADSNGPQLISGDNKDGVYTGTITFLQGTDAGIWYADISVSDSIGNRKTFSADELAARGLVNQIQVTGSTQHTTTKSRKRARVF